MQLFVDVLQCRNGDVGVCCTAFHKCFGLLIMLSVHRFVGLRREQYDLVNEGLRYLIKVDEISTSCSQDVQSFIQVTAEINFLDNLTYDVGYSINFFLRTERIDLVMQRFGDLEYRMNLVSITEFLVVLNKERKHHFTQLILDTRREIIKQT